MRGGGALDFEEVVDKVIPVCLLVPDVPGIATEGILN